MNEPNKDKNGTELLKLPYIDSLRGIAAMLIVLVHTTFVISTLDFFPPLKRAIDYGVIGVQLFYILSAFTLCLSMDSRKETTKKSFFIRRFFRIAPLWWFSIIIYTLTSVFYLQEHVVTSSNILTHLSFTHGFFPSYINTLVPGGWSIGIEVLFYLLFPFLFSAFSTIKKTLCGIFTSITLAWFVGAAIQFFYPMIWAQQVFRDWFTQFLLFQLPFFLAGILLYQMYKTKIYPWKQILLGGLGIFILKKLLNLGSIYANGTYIIIPILICFVLYVLTHRSWFWDKNKFLIWMGKISYGVYLFNLLFFLTFRYAFHITTYTPFMFALIFLLALGVVSAFASITYLLIEKPSIAYGKDIIRESSNPKL